jgi:beta-fructofuranosidase
LSVDSFRKPTARIVEKTSRCYIFNRIDGNYEPINLADFIVKGSEKAGMYGTNFRKTSTEPEEFIAYRWYHRLHALAISAAFRVIWKNKEPQIQLNTSKVSLPRVKRL